MKYIFDLIIVALLVLFAVLGARKGFVLTLFGLAGVFIAFFGAKYLSGAFYEPVSQLIQPGIYESITGVSADPDADPAPDASPAPSDETGMEVSGAALSLDDLLERIRSADLYEGLLGLLEDADQLPEEDDAGPVQSLSAYLADLIARAALFLVGFLVILLLWTLLGRLLDLACRLPVLSAANRLGGAALGLVKGALIVILLVWLAQLTGLISRSPDTPVLRLFSNGNLLRLLDKLVQ